MKALKKCLIVALIAALLGSSAFVAKAAYDAAQWQKLVDSFRPLPEIVSDLNTG